MGHDGSKKQSYFDRLSAEDQAEVRAWVDTRTSQMANERQAARDALAVDSLAAQQILNDVNAEIARNDDWFRAAQSGSIQYTRRDFEDHERRAKSLWDRKRFANNAVSTLESGQEQVDSQLRSQEQHDTEQLRLDLESEAQRLFEIRKKESDEKEVERDRVRRRQAIRDLAQQRDIRQLCHFTPIRNLHDISRAGLLARDKLDPRKCVFPDSDRIDRLNDHISVSISQPNFKVFLKKRKSDQLDVDCWAVLLLDPAILWTLRCKFFSTNAASATMRDRHHPYWETAEAFESMFGRSARPQLTEDIQAEVMVYGQISLEYIRAVAIETETDASRFAALTSIPLTVQPKLFPKSP